jgi:hypothetical protein
MPGRHTAPGFLLRQVLFRRYRPFYPLLRFCNLGSFGQNGRPPEALPPTAPMGHRKPC